MCALLHAVCSLWPLFPRDPLADIGWAMEECRAFLLTRAQEAHHLDIHQCQLIQVQHRPGPLTSMCACKASRCAACRWPISRSVVVCSSTCRSILPVICAASCLPFVRSTTADTRSYRKNGTTRN